ncbi:MAG: 6-phosphogluconolactonase [Propionibacteriaceae bacterium]|jgi:6-phosphogluconolactonase|nr:6-phosphogluconolactonase [Propionibacteriaceae bacterium]
MQLIRHLDIDDLAERTAARAVNKLLELQAEGRIPQLCLSHGSLARKVYRTLAPALEASAVDASALEVWFSGDNFVSTDSHMRMAGSTLALFAGHISFDPARVHSLPAAEASIDPAVAADSYSKELGDTQFDICILEVSPVGGVGGLSAAHQEITPGRAVAIIPKEDGSGERLALTEKHLSNSQEVWMLAAGSELAEVFPQALAGDEGMPAGQVRGLSKTIWLADRQAAANIPYFECGF